MVILDEETEIKLKTPAQEALYIELLQSSAFTKTERDKIVKSTLPKVISCYDASVFIDFLMIKIRYQKHFFGKRKHAIAQCAFCNNRIDLQRFSDADTSKKFWLCAFCRSTADASKVVPVKIDENMEAKADLQRKYDSADREPIEVSNGN